MSLPLALAVYFMAWWTVLFAVLPIGVRRQEDGPEGSDPGAPDRPRLLLKFAITSVLAAGATGVVEVIARMD